MSEVDGFDLGLPEPKPKREAPAAPPTTRTWARYTALARRYCDPCLEETPKINGAPERQIPRALYTEDGPDGRLWLCERHRNERSLAHEIAGADERHRKSQFRRRKRGM